MGAIPAVVSDSGIGVRGIRQNEMPDPTSATAPNPKVPAGSGVYRTLKNKEAKRAET